MKHTLILSLLLVSLTAAAQRDDRGLFFEIGLSPTSIKALQPGALAQMLYRLDAFEFAASTTAIITHGYSTGIHVQYRFPGTHKDTEPNEGWQIGAGMAYKFPSAAAIQSGEGVTKGVSPIGLVRWNYTADFLVKSGGMELRYQGDAFQVLFTFRL